MTMDRSFPGYEKCAVSFDKGRARCNTPLRYALLSSKKTPEKDEPVTLRKLANHLGLSLTTVSVVVSDSPAAQAIPLATRKRILAAATELHYRPNYFARSLRKKRSMSVGVLVSEMSEGYFTLVMNGVEEYLVASKYFYLLAAHYWQPELIEEYPKMLLERSVDVALPGKHSNTFARASADRVHFRASDGRRRDEYPAQPQAGSPSRTEAPG